jgi:hypothetical protein
MAALQHKQADSRMEAYHLTWTATVHRPKRQKCTAGLGHMQFKVRTKHLRFKKHFICYPMNCIFMG